MLQRFRTIRDDRLKLPGMFLFAAAILIAPWFRGAARPAVEQWLAVLLILAFSSRFLDDPRSSTPGGRIPFTWWTVAGGALLGLVQLIPLSSPWLDAVSPQLVDWTEATPSHADSVTESVSPDVVSSLDARRPASVSPALTRLVLAQLTCALAVMLFASDHFRKGRPQRLLLLAVTLNGAAIAFIALVEKLLARGVLFWDPHKHWLGPFVNRNNGAAYLVMSIGAALALILIELPGRETKSPSERSWHKTLVSIVRRLDAPLLAYVAAICLMLAAVAVSLSRGAMISLVVGAVTAFFAIAIISGMKRIAIGAAVLVAGTIGIPASLGLLGDIQARLSTLSEADTFVQDARVINWAAGARAAREFLPVGSGLGTYRYVYRPFETVTAAGRFHYPENTFVQTLVEAGVPGVSLLILGLGAAFLATIRLVRSRDRGRRALGIAGLFILSAQAVHSCLDNGFYLPANVLLLAAICGMFCGAATDESSAPENPNSKHFARPFDILKRALMPVMLTGLAFAVMEFHSAAPGTDAFADLYDFRDDRAASADFVERALIRLEQAVRARPDDAELRRRTAEFYFARYRRQAVAELSDTYPAASPEALWELATPSNLFAVACRAERDRDEEALLALRSQPIVTANLIPAWKHLRLAAAAVPMEAETQLYLGELQFLVGSTDRAASRFALAGRLAPGRPALLLRLGLDEVDAGFKTAGFAHLRRCWTIEPALGDRILPALSARVPWPDIVTQVVPESPLILLELLSKMRLRGAAAEEMKVLENRLAELHVAVPESGER